MDAETKGLVERMAFQIEDWDEEEPRENWWRYQRDFAQALATITRLTAERDEARAEVRELQEALVQHNDRLRSAQQVASRDGADTNWLSFRGAITYTLAEYHELSNKARAALTQEATDGQS